MNLYEMLDCTIYYQNVQIYETNIYGQNMPIFKGEVSDARKDEDHTWNHLMEKVDRYEIINGILIIFVINENYDKRMEEHYLFSEKWGREKDKRPWRYLIEIEEEAPDRIRIDALEMEIEALEKADKYRWHDLRKDPTDLPKEGIAVICAIKGSDNKEPARTKMCFYDWEGWNSLEGWPLIVQPIAWKYIEKFEEAEK